MVGGSESGPGVDTTGREMDNKTAGRKGGTMGSAIQTPRVDGGGDVGHPRCSGGVERRQG